MIVACVVHCEKEPENYSPRGEVLLLNGTAIAVGLAFGATFVREFKKGSGTYVRSTLRAVPAKVPDPFLNRFPAS
jgi:hypothetical protein